MQFCEKPLPFPVDCSRSCAARVFGLRFAFRVRSKEADLQLGLPACLQVFNVFLVTTFSGAVSQSLNQILNSPSSILSILGTAIPVVGFICPLTTGS